MNGVVASEGVDDSKGRAKGGGVEVNTEQERNQWWTHCAGYCGLLPRDSVIYGDE
jgi:hypothetical protein